MTRSEVKPVEDFHELFTTWPENETLSVKEVQVKAITLLALTLMLRPSDIAPNDVVFYDSSGLTLREMFTLKTLVFEQNHMKVTFLVSRMTLQRMGFEEILPKSNVV